jgi:hypothetical protein
MNVIRGLAQGVNRLMGGRQHYAAAIAIVSLGVTLILGVVSVQKGLGRRQAEQKAASEAAERIIKELEGDLQKVKEAKQKNQLWSYWNPLSLRAWEAEGYVIKSLAPAAPTPVEACKRARGWPPGASALRRGLESALTQTRARSLAAMTGRRACPKMR